MDNILDILGYRGFINFSGIQNQGEVGGVGGVDADQTPHFAVLYRSTLFVQACLGVYTDFIPCPAEPGYTLPLQTV